MIKNTDNSKLVDHHYYKINSQHQLQNQKQQQQQQNHNHQQNQLPSPHSLSKYGDLKNVGRGNFGDVYRAIDLNHKLINGKPKYVALKVINIEDSNDDLKQILKEIQFLNNLKNQNIVEYIESFIQGYNIFIVMEYCGGGSCSDLIKYHKKLNELVVGYIIKQVLMGLLYIHNEHKVHRDIKSANILLTEDGIVKLGDFGVSADISLTKKKKMTFVGTPFWMAPEVITRGSTNKISNNNQSLNKLNKKNDGYDYKADIWSLGITVIELITGSPPLSEHDPLKIIFDIPKKKPPQLKGSQYSENIKDFIKYCCLMDPEKRPNCKKLLSHHFIKKISQQNLELSKKELIKLINLKNQYFLKRSRQLKPRHKLNSDLVENLDQRKKNKNAKNKDNDEEEEDENEINNENKVEWEFTRTLQLQMDKANNNNKSNIPYLQINQDSLNKNEFLRDFKLKHHSINNQEEEDEENNQKFRNSFNSSTKNQSQNQSYSNNQNNQNNNHINNNNEVFTIDKKSILFYSLSNVLKRSKDHQTQKNVLKLIEIFKNFEDENPGLCNALIEEIKWFM
ncbi:uncharacterized protein KGF55_000577 [Candida pseudojiufengensis]|uniref:uncharacterized protein n=1 Tax=Candida pseudojiufengensis TaxID=497109 RepID=UPI002224B587|nr:uncharacterized protein KGF55_000577 [Candida pseudojiufengensis]KAI5966268.1 hypothetical protein KGF55_000577 [Candida pseudojiufengensis]